MEENNEVMEQKVRYFFDKKTKVHIKKKNGYIHNGLILEVEKNLLILDDKFSGSMPIYFVEIFEIEKMEEGRG